MKYINFTKDNIKLSRLGYGLMRLPTIGNDNKLIDYKKARELVEYAVDNGINYLDTAFNYHNEQSEIFTGELLKDGLREKIYLASKSPVFKIEKEEDFEIFLNMQLQKLQTDYIDFYLLHTLDKNYFETVKKFNLYEKGIKAKEEGKIKYLGFSFHDDIDTFKEIIDTYDFDFCQIQLNYLDDNFQAGIEGLKYAKEKGLSVIIMEPLRGGQLVNLPHSLHEDIENKTLAELAFSYLFNMEEVDLVLSGMNEFSQIDENIEIASKVTPNSLSQEECNEIHNLKTRIESRIKVECTRCNYCMPCPVGVKIPEIFKIYNNKYIFEDAQKATSDYENLVEKNSDQGQCIECGQCESACPQNLAIINDLKEARIDLIGE